MELWRYCDIDEALSPKTADVIWNKSAEKLQSLPVQELIKKSKVEALCTTDDPTDDLKYHKAISEASDFNVRVLPAFRPDKALNIENNGWREYMQTLSAAANVNIVDVDSLKAALSVRMDVFAKHGCRAADHGIIDVPFSFIPETADIAFKKATNGESLSINEIEAFRTELLLFCGHEYAKRGWVMEIHFGALRNVSGKGFTALGPDSGFDAIGQPHAVSGLAQLLNELERRDSLPKVLLFSLNPNDNAALCTLAGVFGHNVQQGSAWWFNDTKNGMVEQMKIYAELLPLGSFIGFLTDSRSFLSYTRHEYFRRILCNLVGPMVDAGEYPDDWDSLEKIITGICYMNAKRFFDI
jgi:glucuronate isomerase